VKFVVLGDVGLKSLYHVGDEAMTEVAVEMLRDHDPEQITLVVGDPETATAQYGLPAVKRIGFSPGWTRRQSNDKLARETSAASLDNAKPGSVAAAVRNADAVVIAGGGNMTSRYAHHLYERVAITRMAKYYGKPLLVTSQTVGPVLRAADEDLLGEIVEYALLFGARDDDSFALLHRIGGQRASPVVQRTADDAVLLDSDPSTRASDSSLSARYIVASFTSDRGTTDLSQDEYQASIAETLKTLADQLDADVLLVPHTGAPGGDPTGDEVSDAAIVELAAHPRVRALRVGTARETAALCAGAVLCVSTRYHSAVFSLAASTPTVAVSLSFYSTVRFRGAMAPLGLDAYIVPASAWDEIVPAAIDAVQRWRTIESRVRMTTEGRRAAQRAWWAAMIDSAREGHVRSLPEFPTLSLPPIAEEWSDAAGHAFLAFDAESRERTRTEWMRRDIALLEQAVDKGADDVARETAARVHAERSAETLRRRVNVLESRKVVRIANRLTAMARTARRAASPSNPANEAKK